MSGGIAIIGSSFAARRLVRDICKQGAGIPLTLAAADNVNEYNRLDLGHVTSQGQRADDLTCQTAGELAKQLNPRLFPHTWVMGIDAKTHMVESQDNQW